MNLIIVNKNEIAVGQALPWSLYDQAGTLLLEKGEQVRDQAQQEMLLARGACHEMSWGIDGDGKDADPIKGGDSLRGRARGEEARTRFTFEDMKLRIGDRLQLEPPAHLTRERFSVKVIGFVHGVSLLVTMPIAITGLCLQLREKEKVVLRSFSGQNAFGFGCSILRICKMPLDYMHLSFPDDIQGIMIRKAHRIKTKIVATAGDSESAKHNAVPVLITDISAKGVSLEAKNELGEKGNDIHLAFRVQLHNVDAYLSLKGVIRAKTVIDPNNESRIALARYGIEFQDLPANDSVILQSLIYQQLIENPDKLV